MHTSRIRGCINVRRKRVKGLSLARAGFFRRLGPLCTHLFFSFRLRGDCGLHAADSRIQTPPRSRVCGGLVWALSRVAMTVVTLKRGGHRLSAACVSPQTAKKKKQGPFLLYAVKTTKRERTALAGLRCLTALGAFLRAAPPISPMAWTSAR